MLRLNTINTDIPKSKSIHKSFCYAAIIISLLLTGCAGTSPQTNASAVESSFDRRQTENFQTGTEQPADISDSTKQPTNSHSTESTDHPADSDTNISSHIDVVNTDPQPDTELTNARNAVFEHLRDSTGLTADDVTFIKEELDYDDGIGEYEFEFVTATDKYEYEVRAADYAITKYSVESIEQIQHTAIDTISKEAAKEIALDYAGLSADQINYTKIELDYHVANGNAEYEIEFYADGTEYEFTIDAVTGKILEAETDKS